MHLTGVFGVVFGIPNLFFALFFVVVFVLPSILKIVNQYEKGVRFTLGRFSGIMEPGLRIIIPVLQSWQRIDMRIRAVDVPSQDCVSKDNVTIKVNAVLYFKVADAKKAVIEVESFGFAVSQLAQTTMRNIVGEFELDEILQKREEVSQKIQAIVDKATDPWGIKVDKIELKDIELPDTMKRAMAHQAEAERDRRARVTLALGEQQAAQKLTEAGKAMGAEPATWQLRLFQTMSEVASEKNSTLILPIPVELLQYFKNMSKK